MKNSSFKNELAKFLIKEWQDKKYGSVIKGKTVYVSHGGCCVKLFMGPGNALSSEFKDRPGTRPR